MRFAPEFLDELRNRLPLSEVVGKRVTWDQRKSQFSKGDYWACCPFHEEKTPSFHVDDRKGFYHCFGCGASGDHLRFLTDAEGLSFPEAVEQLAEQAGVPMPAPDPAAARRAEVRASLADVVAMASRFFQDQFRSAAGSEARAYAERRGLDRDTLATFEVGYAPGTRDALKRHLAASGVSEGQMAEAGLVIVPDDGRAAYDRFRNRLMIPIHDIRGRIVAFGGRALAADQEPKYLNSPETPLFNKRAVLFNAHRARSAAHEAGAAIVVEGYLDAIAVHRAGLRHVVASLGTAFTEDQIRAMWKLAPEPVICFDGDKAGVSAANRAVDRILPLLESGRSFNFCFLPDGKDPDDLISASGVDGFLSQIAAAKPLVDVVWDRERRAGRLDTPERKAALEARIEQLVEAIQDQRVRRRYHFEMRGRLGDLFRGPGRKPNRESGGAMDTVAATGFAIDTDLAELERIVLGICLGFPGFVDRHWEQLERVAFSFAPHERLKQAILGAAVDEIEPPAERVRSRLDPGLARLFDDVYGSEPAGGRLVSRFPVVAAAPPEGYVERCLLHFLDRLDLKTLEADLETDIAQAGPDLTADGEARILALSRELVRRRQAFQEEDRDLADQAKEIRGANADAARSTSALPVPG
ncbi:DNA primase [Amorphus orientalis]|uniref:DNA primase n=1 Tax=Amorphus orientalis TaxID=649198 RepID=A0AAE4ARP5_9HYPH|nr:DNA primase [Amorphus orientalis]MDQ0314085.1 DNA primase [Amorphus orientalis]